MSRKIAQFLAKPEAEINKSIAKLESANGYPSEDVRLLAENKQKLRDKIRQLGLDPDDTTDQELYWTLLARYSKDSDNLDRALGVSSASSLDERISKAAQLVGYCTSIDEMWLVKNPIAKSVLTTYPPKQLAKKLHYRSLSSLTKREAVAEIYLAAKVVESATWKRAVSKQFSKLNAANFELRPLKIVQFSARRWTAVDGPASHVINDRWLGSVGIWPSADLRKTSVLSLTLLLLSSIQRLNPGGYKESLHELSPTLRWWTDCDYLVSDGEQPISFNLKDLAFNHLKKHELEKASFRHGGRSLWDELTSRYRKISQSLSDVPLNSENVLNELYPAPKLPDGSELAAESVTVE